MSEKNWKWIALSPDGFELNREPKLHDNSEQALQECKEWKERYRHQGYYSHHELGKIPFENIELYCKAKMIKV